jgi:molybdate transport system ATP-binding protein
MLAVDIEKRLGDFAIKVAFESKGGVTALFGSSGSGKTSIVNMVAGLIKPDRGRIALDDQVLFDSTARVNVPLHQRRIGYVFQEGRLFPHLTVQQNLAYSRLFVSRPPAAGEFDHVVGLLGLDGLLARRPAQLSGGEKQRVAIGRALLAQPRLLLLDEPLASLDQVRKREILQYLELLRDDVRIPIIYVSHTVEEVVRLADTVVLLSSGKVVAVGDVEEVMGRPDLRPAAGVFEGGAVIDARVTGQDIEYDLATLAFDGGTLTVTNLDALIGEPVRVRVRARGVSIALEPPQRISIQNVLRGRIAAIDSGRDGIVDVTIAVGAVMLRSRVTRRAAHQLALAPGLDVYALIKAVSLDRSAGGYA